MHERIAKGLSSKAIDRELLRLIRLSPVVEGWFSETKAHILYASAIGQAMFYLQISEELSSLTRIPLQG